MYFHCNYQLGGDVRGPAEKRLNRNYLFIWSAEKCLLGPWYVLDGTVCWAYSNELNVASLPSEPLCIDLGNGCQQSTAMLILSFNTIIIIVTPPPPAPQLA